MNLVFVSSVADIEYILLKRICLLESQSEFCLCLTALEDYVMHISSEGSLDGGSD